MRRWQLLKEQQRRNAKRNLLAYTEYTFPGYHVAPHHQIIADGLERIARGEIANLLITCPPRHGKSQLASQRFPAWYLGQPGHEKREIISASYGDKLAVNIFGRRLRNLLQTREHLEVFPDLRMSPDSKASDLWHTTQGGVFVAAGVGGAITGFGANLLLIDDPVKGFEEAMSLTVREKSWNWYVYDAYSRVMEGAKVVIGTRWHEDDPIGRLLREQDAGGDQWEHIFLPAINSKGEALWPERYNLDYLNERRRLDERMFNCLYQGDPTPEEGNFFKREWIKYYEKLPSSVRYYAASDYAVTSRGGDYTVHLIAAVDEQDRIYIVDVWREQAASDVWVEATIALMRKYQPMIWAEEAGQIISSIGPYLQKRMREENIYCLRRQFTSAVDKQVRARSIQARWAEGMVYIPRGTTWVAAFVDELLKFDQGAHDDQVDAVSLIGRMLAGMIRPTRPEVPERPKYWEDLTLDELWAENDAHYGGH